MACKPRRTSEFCESASRVSRIAQPIRRSQKQSTAVPDARSRSVDRESAATNLLSAQKRMRSISATPLTRAPSSHSLRTPLLTPKYSTPGSGSRLQRTGEKERAPVEDKKWLHTQVGRINNYISAHPVGGMQRGGIKSMTFTQFRTIVVHLLERIVGNRYTIKDPYIDDIMNILATLDYPYTINKSWLKTPTASHSFCHIVAMMAWLLDFVEAAEETEEVELIPDTDFPSMCFQRQFKTLSEDAFGLWNQGNEEEFQLLVQVLQKEFVKEKLNWTKDGDLSSVIEQLQAENERLQQSIKPIKLSEELERLDAEAHKMQETIKRLRASSSAIKEEGRRLQAKKVDQEKALKVLNADIRRLEDNVGSQRMTTKQRDEMIQHVAHLKLVLNEKKRSVQQLQELEASNPVVLARLIKQKVSSIASYNSFVFQLSAVLRDLHNFKPDALYLDANSRSLGDDIEASAMQLAKIFAALNAFVSEKSDRQAEVRRQLSDLELSQRAKENEERDLKAKVDQALTKYEKINEELLQETLALSKLLEAEKSQIAEINQAIEREKIVNEECLVAVKTLEAEKQKLMQKFLAGMDSALEKRNEEIKNMDELIKEQEETLKKLEEKTNQK